MLLLFSANKKMMEGKGYFANEDSSSQNSNDN